MTRSTPRSARGSARGATGRLAVALALGGALLLTGCGLGTTGVRAAGDDPAAHCGPSTVAAPQGDPVSVAGKAEPELPVTVRSADGKEVTVRDADRILAVNLYGSLAEIVHALGLGDRLVGRDISTTFPAAADLPLVTGQGHDLSAEGVLKLDPSVVITDPSMGPPEVLDQLRESGVPVVLVDDEQTLPAVGAHIRAVAAALGVPAAGTALAERVDGEIKAAAKSATGTLTIGFLYLRGSAGVYLIGGDGAGSDAMIEAIGATDAGSAIGMSGFRPLTSEGLINAAPDVLLLMTAGLDSVGGVSGLLKLPGVAQTPAGQHKRIVDVADGTLLTFGSRTGETISALSDAVYRAC